MPQCRAHWSDKSNQRLYCLRERGHRGQHRDHQGNWVAGRPRPSGEVEVVDPKTGGRKGEKPERYALIPFDALDEVARVYGKGAEKYEAHNWLKGYRWSLSCGALLRHVSLFLQGEDCDPETGRHHLAHAVFHCLALITFGRRRLGTDDRAKAPRG